MARPCWAAARQEGEMALDHPLLVDWEFLCPSHWDQVWTDE